MAGGRKLIVPCQRIVEVTVTVGVPNWQIHIRREAKGMLAGPIWIELDWYGRVSYGLFQHWSKPGNDSGGDFLCCPVNYGGEE